MSAFQNKNCSVIPWQHLIKSLISVQIISLHKTTKLLQRDAKLLHNLFPHADFVLCVYTFYFFPLLCCLNDYSKKYLQYGFLYTFPQTQYLMTCHCYKSRKRSVPPLIHTWSNQTILQGTHTTVYHYHKCYQIMSGSSQKWFLKCKVKATSTTLCISNGTAKCLYADG